MKKLILLLMFFTFFTSCESEGKLTENPVNTEFDINQAVLKFSGTLQPTSGISGSGMVKIYQQNTTYYLRLDNYTIENGPDLKVYLSKTDSPSDFVNLGAVNPDNTYIIPSQVNLADYPYALIHCQQYNHLFAVAALQEN